MPDWIPSLIPQFGALVIFIWYLRDAEARREKATKENHELWQRFWAQQREMDRAVQAHQNENVAALTASIIAHDNRMAGYGTLMSDTAADVQRIRERLAAAGIGKVDDSPLPPGRK